MKPRRVFVMLELETSQPLSKLKKQAWWAGSGTPFMRCYQVQVNVAQGVKRKRSRRKA